MRTSTSLAGPIVLFVLALAAPGAPGAPGDADARSAYAEALEAARLDPGSADFAERAAYHRAFGAGLRDSILNAETDGAYPVISLTEERAILMHFDCYGAYEQSLTSDPGTGRFYDEINCKVGEQQEERTFKFDITAFFGRW